MQIFFDPESPAGTEAFNEWRLSAGRRYVLTLPAAGEARLHRGKCPTFVFHGTENLTAERKLCSEDYQELKRWAAGENRDLKRCLKCKPPV